jgi:hypothetical protein
MVRRADVPRTVARGPIVVDRDLGISEEADATTDPATGEALATRVDPEADR